MSKYQSGLLILWCIIFFGLGMTVAGIGPCISELASHIHSDLASTGGIFTAIFLGSLLAQFWGGRLSDRFGSKPIFLAGLIFMCVGIFCLTRVSTLASMLVFGVIGGIGFGTTALSGNILIAEAFHEEKRVSSLNWLNLFYGIGAVTGPLFAGFFLSLWKTGLPALWIGSLLSFLPTVGYLILRVPSSLHQMKELPQTISFHSMTLWLLSIFLFTYVGIETGLGGWLPTYVQKTELISPNTAALVASGFWLALAFGRLIIASFGSRFSSLHVLAMSLTCSLVGSIMLILGNGQITWTFVGVFFTGLGFGPLYPTAMAVVTTRFRSNSGSAVGLAVASGSLGGMVIPYLQGLIMQEQGPAAAVSLPFAGLLIMGAVFTAVNRQS